jgi:hypothetical protein
MTKTLISATALTTASLALALAGPATADSIGTRDADDSPHGSDLRSVVVRNTDTKIHVVTTHDGLRPDPRTGSAGQVYVDTDRSDRGPEFVLVGAYFRGSDYQLVHTEGFGSKKWGERATGFYELKVDYDKEQVHMHMSRRALGRPHGIRVAVRVSGTRTDGTSTGLVDWLGDPHSFTPWVARG